MAEEISKVVSLSGLKELKKRLLEKRLVRIENVNQSHLKFISY